MSVVSSEITPGPGTVLPFSPLIDAAALLLPLIIDTMYLEDLERLAGHVVDWDLSSAWGFGQPEKYSGKSGPGPLLQAG